jgi:hypothetical protein
MVLATAAMIGVALCSGEAGAKGAAQTVELVKVDVTTRAAGYRASTRAEARGKYRERKAANTVTWAIIERSS